jgi:hypothetical protein
MFFCHLNISILFCLMPICKNKKKIIMINKKTSILLTSVLFSIVALSYISGVTQNAFADSDTKPVVKATEQLRKNPLAMKILAEMEAQKLKYKQQILEKSQPLKLTVQQIEVEKQRQVAKERMSERLDAFLLKYQDKLPKAAYTKFVEKKPEKVQGLFWGMFDYMQGKVSDARNAMKEVLDNGGSLKDARDAYFSHAATKRVQLIQVVEDLNVQHGFAEKSVQDTFDEQGKLPRTDA